MFQRNSHLFGESFDRLDQTSPALRSMVSKSTRAHYAERAHLRTSLARALKR
jgi:hypothetical protein